MSLGSGSASTTSSTSTTTTTHSLGEKTPPFWELDVSSALVIDANGQQQQQQQSLPPVTSQSNTFNNSYNYITKSNNNNNNPLMVWMSKQLRSSAATAASLPIDVVPSVAQTLCQHVFRSVSALLLVEESQLSTNGGTSSSNNNNHNNIINHHNEEEEDPDNTDRPEANRKKRKKTVPIRRFLMDPYKIWFQSGDSATPAEVGSSEVGSTAVSSAAVALLATAKPWDDNQDDIPETAGGKLAVLSVGGLLNALAGQVVCTASTVVGNNLNALQKQAVLSGTANALAKTFGTGITILQLHAVASALHTAIADQVKLDILRTTPNRIHNLLAPDLTVAEFQSIRRRVYDTVILGKGLSSSDHNDASSNDLPTAASGAVHDIEKFKKCNLCGNNNQSDFILDRKNGDLICEHCGAIVSESIMHEGSQFRKFEGEVDRNHHGDAGNALYSNAHNMGTSLSGVAPTTGAGMGGWGSGGGSSGSRRNLETILKNAHAYTELNVSQFGKTDRRTRIGYKDRQKKDAFIQMTHAGDALNLHEAVVQRAKELFAGTFCKKRPLRKCIPQMRYQYAC